MVSLYPELPSKDPAAVEFFQWDWSGRMGETTPTDTISTSVFLVGAGLTGGSESKTADSTTIELIGGVNGVVYEILNTVVTAAGRTLTQTFLLPVLTGVDLTATFVVEDGTGLVNANSYSSVSDANDYINAYGGSTTWINASTEEKETALRMATRYIDFHYSARWKGLINSTTQALSWPRYDVIDEEKITLVSTVIDLRLVNSCIELAKEYVIGNGLDKTLTPLERGQLSEKEVEAGAVRVLKKWLGGSPDRPTYATVENMLGGLLKYGGSTAQILRSRG